MSVPSVYDTHCSGAGLSPSTKAWTQVYCQYKRFTGDRSAMAPYPPRMDLSGKNVLISGANSGIGLEAAYTFAQWGANVILACRDPPPHEIHPTIAIKSMLERSKGTIKEDQLTWWEVDFASLKSVEALGKRWMESGMTLDYLCNNAGLSMRANITTEDGFELTRSVNYLGHCLLTLIVLPSMKKAKTPRIVNTCSCFHFGGRLDFSSMDYEKGQSRGSGGVDAYCDSKLYHVMWSFELQSRLSRSEDYRHVVVNAVHPGFVGSNIWNNPDIASVPWPAPQVLAYIISKVSIPTSQGSLCILYGALHPKFGFRPSQLEESKGKPSIGASKLVGGHYINRNVSTEARPECSDVLATSRLWERTLEDIKAKERGLDQVAPGHLPEFL
ncbi:hypothetical protein CBS101457_005305 [Exobasidium rhododendri]|nr:hypothetical protein CBS101457_005305 [Exobasidium rhododendri]